MKKFLSVLLSLVVALVAVVSPAFAAGQRSKVEVLYTPSTVYQGETIEVSFKVTARGGKTGKWQVELPKSVISAVSVEEKRGLSLVEGADKYSMYFDLKHLKSQTVTVKLTISSSAISTNPLLTIYDHNNIFVEQKQVEVLVPELVWSVESPYSYPISTNFQIFLQATNNTTLPLSFDIDTEFFHQCTDRSVYPSVYPVLAIDGGGNSVSYWMRFFGEVPAGQTFEWVFDMRSAGYACDAPVFELRDNQSNDLTVWKQWIKILAP